MTQSTTLSICLLALLLSTCTSRPKAPPQPALVPKDAVWAGGIDGGSFFQCDVDTQHNVNRCLVYNDHTGDVEGGGFFRISDANRAARNDELQYRFFDGDHIYLASGTLIRVEVISPKGLPDDAVFANGLFIHCGDMSSSRAQCEIYRPDGSEYFSGSFVADTVLGGNSRDGFKFFDLSDRTINLLSGGALVSR